MIFKMKHVRFFYLVILLTACAADKNKTMNIQGYDYTRMKKFELEHPLKEISGIAYYQPSKSFIAINDEKGTVYVLNAKTFRITNKYAFGEAGDYEEVQVAGNNIYVLRSDGTIFKMKFDGTTIADVESFEYSGPKAEYESFYVDAESNTLILIPKHSKAGAKEQQTVTYTINISDGKYVEKKEQIFAWSNLKNNVMFHPSAVAVHPVSKDIYILASIEKKLIVLNADWKILAEYELDRASFQQPEGITFDTDGNLYITNEAGGSLPTLIQIPILSK